MKFEERDFKKSQLYWIWQFFQGNQEVLRAFIIAAKSIAFGELLTDEFLHYMLQGQRKNGSGSWASAFVERDIILSLEVTDNHMCYWFLEIRTLQVKMRGMLGKSRITANKIWFHLMIITFCYFGNSVWYSQPLHKRFKEDQIEDYCRNIMIR